MTKDTAIEKKLYEMHAGMCGVFTSPKRLEIINLLRGGEMTVGELAERAGIRQSNLSQHLGILREKGIVTTRRDGVRIYYSLSNPKIIRAFDIIREMLFEKMAREAEFTRDLREARR